MISTHGFWYDGKVSLRHDVTITCADDGSLRVCGEGVDVTTPLAEVRIDPALGAARRMVRFPNGAAAEATDYAFLDELLRRQGKGTFFRAVSRWESSLTRAFAALILMLLLGFGFVRYAVPPLATKVAFTLPASTEEMIGRETLQFLDRVVLKPSRLPEQRRSELSALFSSMEAHYPDRRNWELEFRSGEGIGANAFALPAGKIVITDRLVQIAKSDDEIAAVLAHEIGHLNRRHTLRHILQNSVTALIVATVTGDITSFSATVPTMLIDAKFSRDFEVEADDAAVAYLKAEHIPVKVFADILTRLGEDHRQKVKGNETAFGELFSDHPMIQERVKRVLARGN